MNKGEVHSLSLPVLPILVGESDSRRASVRNRTVREVRSPRAMVRDCARSSRAEPAATGETPSAERRSSGRSWATWRAGAAVGEPGEVDGAGEAPEERRTPMGEERRTPMGAVVLSRCVACRLIAKEAGSYGLAEDAPQRRRSPGPELGPGESAPG